MKRRFRKIVLIVIGFLILVISIVIFYVLLGTNNAEWKIEVLNLPNIIEENFLTIQTELESPETLEENEIRIAAFQIYDPEGVIIRDAIMKLWQKKGILQVGSIGFEGRNLWVRFNEDRIEIWTSADKFFTADGQVVVRIAYQEKSLFAVADVSVSHLPIRIEDI